MNGYKTWIEIDRKKLLRNLHFFKKLIGPSVKLMTVIKANAYGHGLLETSSILKKDKSLFFGVDSIDEALSLRKAGIKNEIMILGYIPLEKFREAVENNFHVSIYNDETLKTALKFPRGLFHIKVETGTNRLGLNLDELSKFRIRQLADNMSKFKIAGVYTHFADVENRNSNFYNTQLAIFNNALKILKSKNIYPKFIHIASTASILRDIKTHFNLVRLGIGLYKNVLSWKAKVAQVKNLKVGATVGYDRTFKATKDIKIAVLPVGYYDGYDRRLSNSGMVLVNGKLAKIIGRVCMNMIMADITNIKAKPGDEAIIFGGKIKAENTAKQIGTIDYEVLARLGSHLPRIVV